MLALPFLYAVESTFVEELSRFQLGNFHHGDC